MNDEDEFICPDCAGSGEGLLSPPGTGRCRRCKGSGSLSDAEGDEPEPPERDFEDEERIRTQMKARGYNYTGKEKA